MFQISPWGRPRTEQETDRNFKMTLAVLGIATLITISTLV